MTDYTDLLRRLGKAPYHSATEAADAIKQQAARIVELEAECNALRGGMTKEEAFCEFIGSAPVENDAGWSLEVWSAAWTAARASNRKHGGTAL